MQNEPLFLRKPIPVLYKDESYIVFDKPAGLLVIPTPQGEKNTLVNIVNYQYAPSQGWRLHPCHRLDRETSGAILFAKGKQCQKLMMAAFQKRTVIKKYIALVQGRLPKAAGELRSRVLDFDQKKYRKGSAGQWAITRYRMLQQKRVFGIVEVQPLTGRTNQIRIQFSEIGHPLVGERKYARGRDYALKFRRAALHACALEWTQPVSHKRIHVTADLPDDMEVFIARNGN